MSTETRREVWLDEKTKWLKLWMWVQSLTFEGQSCLHHCDSMDLISGWDDKVSTRLEEQSTEFLWVCSSQQHHHRLPPNRELSERRFWNEQVSLAAEPICHLDRVHLRPSLSRLDGFIDPVCKRPPNPPTHPLLLHLINKVPCRLIGNAADWKCSGFLAVQPSSTGSAAAGRWLSHLLFLFLQASSWRCRSSTSWGAGG